MAKVASVGVSSGLSAPDVTLTPQGLVSELDALFAGTNALFDRARHNRHYQIAGAPFAVSSDLEDYLTAVDQAVASRGSASGAEARLFVGVAGQNGCPSIHWRGGAFEERRIEALLAPTRYRLHVYQPLSFWQIFDRQTAKGLQILAAPEAYPAWDPGSPLRNFLQWHLASRGGALVHAGTLGVMGKGVLLAGAGGSGKSGTVLSGLLGGLTTVGDDYVFVSPADLRAYPLFETLKQDAAGLKRLGLATHHAIPAATNWQNKHQFFMRHLGLAECAQSLSLHALLLPRITGQGKTTPTPISAKEAFLALAPSGVTQVPGDRPLLYATAAEVARRLPSFRLDLGSDPDEVSAALRRFIEST